MSAAARAEARIDRVLTQYRESPRLLGLTRGLLTEVAQFAETADAILDAFDLDTAVGDQLTILGKALGWPRTHIQGQRVPVFGFACDDECGATTPVAGFCEADWDCGEARFRPFTFIDDELYRGFLKARAITLSGDYTREGLTTAARECFDPRAVIYFERPGVTSIATCRLLSGVERTITHLYRQVLPVPPGFALELWHSDGVPFGFGDGWGGMCDGRWPIQVDIQ